MAIEEQAFFFQCCREYINFGFSMDKMKHVAIIGLCIIVSTPYSKDKN